MDEDQIDDQNNEDEDIHDNTPENREWIGDVEADK